jgi:hypothetical protein
MSSISMATRTVVRLTWVGLWLAASCQHSRAVPPAAPAECRDVVQRAVRVGAVLFEHDSAAAWASDAVQARFGRDERVRGWVTVSEGHAVTAFFFGDGAQGPVVLYTASHGTVTKHEPPEPPAPEVEVRIRALRTAAAAPLELRCSEGSNPVVLPAELLGETGWLVYFLAFTRTQGEIVVGGHVRRLVSPDGSTLVRSEPLSKACLTLPPPPRDAAFAIVTHIVTPCPVETHVLAASQHKVPLLVRTKNGYWKIEAVRIETAPPR